MLNSEDIKAALAYDPEAVTKLLAHYSRYMDYLATSFGTSSRYDVDARCRMESKLLDALAKFKY